MVIDNQTQVLKTGGWMTGRVAVRLQYDTFCFKIKFNTVKTKLNNIYCWQQDIIYGC